MAYNLEKLILGGFLDFVEAGKLIDVITVSVSAYPDNDPPENWPSLGAVSEVNFEADKETDTDYIASLSGGYDKVDDEHVIKDLIKFITRDHSEPYWRMVLGLKDEIVNGTAQEVFANSRRYVEGWLRIRGIGDDGAERVLIHIWGRMSIDSNPKWSKDPTKPALKFQKFYSPLGTVLPSAIV